MKISKLTLLGFVALMACIGIGGSAQAAAPSIESRALLFNKGDFDSKYYRIPALATGNDGTIIAVADKRIENNGDLPGKIDVVCKYSKDNGATWSDYITVVAHDENGGYGDPALVVDRNTGDVLCIATHGAGLWTAKGTGDHARIVVMRSKDNGATWSAPTDITDQFFSNEAVPGKIQGSTGFASSGRALQTKDGRLMFVLVVRPINQGWLPLHTYAVYSDDGGYNWTAAAEPSDLDGDESKVVELNDGTILMSIRNRKKGARRFSESKDGGAHWWPVTEASTLIEPACNGDIMAVERNGEEVLYHTIPANPTERRDVSLFESTDRGKTWQKVITVCPAPSAYSSITLLPDGTIGCLTEEETGDPDGGFALWFSKIKLD